MREPGSRRSAGHLVCHKPMGVYRISTAAAADFWRGRKGAGPSLRLAIGTG
jgi:hypothetical protein